MNLGHSSFFLWKVIYCASYRKTEKYSILIEAKEMSLKQQTILWITLIIPIKFISLKVNSEKKFCALIQKVYKTPTERNGGAHTGLIYLVTGKTWGDGMELHLKRVRQALGKDSSRGWLGTGNRPPRAMVMALTY